jgi:hypothetical protein
MSKLKNIFGLPDSIIQTAALVHITNSLNEKNHENELKGNQSKLDVAEPKGKLTKADFDKLRAKKHNISPSEYDDPISKSRKKVNEASTYNFKANQPGQYPFSSAQLTPFFTMLKSLMDIIKNTPSLKKLMRDETGIDDDQSSSLIEFLEILHEEILLENKKEEDEDDKEYEEDENSKKEDAETNKHPMMQIKKAADGGNFVTTKSGPKYVNQGLANKMLDHLISLKPSEREDHIEKITGETHPQFSSLVHKSHENKPEDAEPTIQKKRGRKPKEKA